MGFVFGYQNSHDFYLFDWKKVSANFLGFGVASQGMRLTTFHMDGEDPTGRDFWASDRSDHTTVLLQNSLPWADGVDYDFSLKFTPVTGHVWNRVISLPATAERDFFRIRSIGDELSNTP